MRLPKVVSICGHDIKIVYKKKLFVDGQACWGVYEDSKHTIYLVQGMDKTRKLEIFLHEALHAIEHIYMLSLSEKIVKVLAIEILALVRNNKINLLERKTRGK